MDMTELVLKTMFYILFSPFILFYYICKYFYRWVVRPAIERSHQKRAEVLVERDLMLNSESESLVRNIQLKQLTDSLPKDLPQRMRAVFAVNKIEVREPQQKRIKHLIGEDTFVTDYSQKATKYAADMILQLTETERAIIRQHSLDDVVLEDEAAFSQADLVRIRSEAQERSSSIKDDLLREVTKTVDADVNDMLRHERRKTRVGDLLVSPFSRDFETYHEAHDYLDILKTKHLPQIRQLIDRYRNLQQNQTIEF